MVDIFRDPTKSIPKSDSQIVRVGMNQSEIAGRMDHIPTPKKSPEMSIDHVPTPGSKG